MDVIKELTSQTDNLGAKILAVALLLAAVGTIVMALIEVAKSVFRLRMRFHAQIFTNWVKSDLVKGSRISERAAEVGLAQRKSLDSDHGKSPSFIQAELFLLTCGGELNEEILFDQPTEKMMAQIQSAANVILEFPSQYPNAYAFLTTVRDPAAAKTPGGEATKSDVLLWRNYSARAIQAQLAPDNEAMHARARLGHLVSRRLDMLQNAALYRWARLNQLTSFILGATCMVVLIATNDYFKSNPAVLIFVGIPLAILGGCVAPFAKDLVSALSQFASKG